MAETTRRIGLSLGADLCWPKCYEDILARLDLRLKMGKESVRFSCERVRIDPYDLSEPCGWDLVVDRLTHWYPLRREWIKKAVLLDGLYVFNNPWAVQSMEKHTTYAAMMRLGLPIPRTLMIPPREYDEKPDLKVTLQRYANLFDLKALGDKVGYPSFVKPYDGGGWQGVVKVDDAAELKKAYDASGKSILHLQAGVVPYERFVRCIGFGAQTRAILYDPSQPLHGRYTNEKDFISAEDQRLLEDITLTINAFFGWDFNSCEALLKDGTWWPIDFANPCPDSQVTSLHAHFPWLVKSYLRWSLYCAATKRPMRALPAWDEWFALAEEGGDWKQRVARYGRKARAHFAEDEFRSFCDTHLAHLDEVANEYFGTPAAREAVRIKVAALYPAHEVEPFTQRFWEAIQGWREADKAERAALAAAPRKSAKASVKKT
jgi:hypothetical protein